MSSRRFRVLSPVARQWLEACGHRLPYSWQLYYGTILQVGKLNERTLDTELNIHVIPNYYSMYCLLLLYRYPYTTDSIRTKNNSSGTLSHPETTFEANNEADEQDEAE